MNDPSQASSPVRKLRVQQDVNGLFSSHHGDDFLATEEPLELRVEGRSVAVVMRTPGHDEELAAGFLLTEGVISQKSDLFEISRCPTSQHPDHSPPAAENLLEILLRDPERHDLAQLSRHVFSSSSCGICGKATIESIFQSFPPLPTSSSPLVSPALLLDLPGKLRQAQQTFEKTGGLHASAIFSPSGELLLLREDVGRHNALDKVVGHALLHNLLPCSDHILLVSGRLSFELVQKALAAQIPLVAGISAPSSLAVQFAQASGQTLIGFLREHSLNVYTHPSRVAPL